MMFYMLPKTAASPDHMGMPVTEKFSLTQMGDYPISITPEEDESVIDTCDQQRCTSLWRQGLRSSLGDGRVGVFNGGLHS